MFRNASVMQTILSIFNLSSFDFGQKTTAFSELLHTRKSLLSQFLDKFFKRMLRNISIIQTILSNFNFSRYHCGQKVAAFSKLWSARKLVKLFPHKISKSFNEFFLSQYSRIQCSRFQKLTNFCTLPQTEN